MGVRVATYLRISSDRDGDEYGVDRQRTDLAAMVRARGWEPGTEYVDNDVSAAGKVRRPQFEALMTAVEAGEVDVVAGWALDRICRTARDRLRLLEAGKAHELILALVRGSDMHLGTPAGRLAADILGATASHEIEQKADRQARAALQAAEQGRWIGGRKPFGYADDGVTLIPEEAAAVVDGYAALLAGSTVRAIAARWNADGHTTGQRPWKHAALGDRSPWRADSVRRVLLNPRYAGLRAHRGEETGRAQWPAIVSEETYRAAARLLNEPDRYTGAGKGARQFLTGVAVCALDGCGMTVHGGGASHRKPIYRCSSTSPSHTPPGVRPAVPGTHVNRLAGPVDDHVAAMVVERLSRPDAAELLSDQDRPDVPGLREEATALRGRLESLAEEFAGDPEVTASEYRAMTRKLRGRLAEIEDAIADAGRVSILGPLVGAEDVRRAWDGLDLDRRRAVVELLMEVRLHAVGRGTRTFRPETVEVIWRQ